MIWGWIGAAVALSWLLCRKKAAWHHLIWMLLPIETYGVSLAGATIKPYMMFGGLIILHNILRKKAHKIPPGILAAAFALAVSDLLNGLIVASIMQHIMFLLVIYIAFSYTRMLEGEEGVLGQMESVMTATTIGYGTVFLLAYGVYAVHPQFGGVYTVDRYSPGMFLRFLSAGGVTLVRLRGFCIDPNIVVTTLIPGVLFALERLLYRRGHKLYDEATVICYGAVVVLSGSRMALLSTLAILAVVILSGWRQAGSRVKWLMGVSVLMLVLAGAGLYFYQRIAAEVYGIFTARARLNDEAGRLTIWKYNLNWIGQHGRLLVGIGQNQIAGATAKAKACHNTWLEWVCGAGLPIGMGMILWFLLAPCKLCRALGRDRELRSAYTPLLLAYWITAVCITTVDNITNSVLIFLMILFRYGQGALPLEEAEQNSRADGAGRGMAE